MDTQAQIIAKRYALTGLLGKGGMGSVYLAHDTVLDRTVAIKSLLTLNIENVTRKQAALIEAKTLAQFNHPSILKIYDVIDEDGQIWLVTELIDGKNLGEFTTPFTLEAIFAIAVQVIQALAIIHQKNIFHRDLKPQNILVAKDGRVVLIDFGVAYTSGSSGETLAGSLNYIDPEILAGRGAQAASDLFSFGLVWLELLTQKKVVPDLAPLPLYQFFNERFDNHVQEMCEGLFPPFRTALDFLLRQESQRQQPNTAAVHFTSAQDLAEYFSTIWQKWTKLSPEDVVRNSLKKGHNALSDEFLAFLKSETEERLSHTSLSLRQRSHWLAFASSRSFVADETQHQYKKDDGAQAKNVAPATPHAEERNENEKFHKKEHDHEKSTHVLSFRRQSIIALSAGLLLLLSFSLVYFLNQSSSHNIPPPSPTHKVAVGAPLPPAQKQSALGENPRPQDSENNIASFSDQKANLEAESERKPQNIVPAETRKKLDRHSQKETKKGLLPQCFVRIAANAWADVKIDGKPLGRIPRAEPFLFKGGEYTLHFSSPFIETKEKKFVLCDKKDVNIYIELAHKTNTDTPINAQGTPK